MLILLIYYGFVVLRVGVKKRAARVVKPRIEKKPRPNLEETLKNLGTNIF